MTLKYVAEKEVAFVVNNINNQSGKHQNDHTPYEVFCLV